MAKNTNKIIAGALAVVGVYFVFKYFKKPKAAATPAAPTEVGGGTPSISRNDNFPLKRGSKGRNVSALQQWLLKIDKTILPKFGADGDFGAETEAAVQKILGKKTVDSNADFDRLMVIYNQKTFPLMTNVPKPVNPNQLPTFPNIFGTTK